MSQHVDIAIIGGGITGLTAAVLLQERGKRVAVIEKDRAGSGESGRSTAHVTEAIDARYTNIARNFSKDAARSVASSMRAAIEQIATLVRGYSIDCHFKRLPGYFYTEKRSHIAEVKREAQTAADLGLKVRYEDEAPLPFLTRAAARFDDQAQFNPREYLNGLASRVQVFGNMRVIDVREGEPCVVECDRATFTADAVFMATNVPIAGFQSLHFNDESYRTYVLAFASAGDHPNGLFWDTADPYHYTRWMETSQGTVMLVGGEDHKVGQRDTEESYAKLQEYTAELWSPQPLRDRWSGQIIEPVDGLPYIGASGKFYVSTGYAGQGTTFGTLGAMIVADLITGKPNEWAELYDWKRIATSTVTSPPIV
ncbi:MAG TPA: FAD-binding oxidoreductase [Thermoanaerobaculia bacterium]|nr:FAD-binding oxidoreductase [Thermoanaerobaculia bacterium]